MTTDAAMDELGALTSNKAAVEAEALNNRSNNRSPVRNWTGTVESISTSKDGYGGKEVINLHVTGLVVHKAITPYTGDSIDFSMSKPKKANIHSEVGQMVASAIAIDPSIDDVRDLRGKKLTCEETVHEFKGREQVTPGDWQDTTFKTTYYKVTGIGGNSNGTKAEVVVANPDVLAAVLSYASGLTAEDFKAVLKDVPGAAQDVAIRSSIISGKFLTEQVAAGNLILDSTTNTYEVIS